MTSFAIGIRKFENARDQLVLGLVEYTRPRPLFKDEFEFFLRNSRFGETRLIVERL